MSIIGEVNRMILEATRGMKPPEKIFLSKDKWIAFVEEMEPFYREYYGAFLARELDYDNIVYQGVAVCMENAT